VQQVSEESWHLYPLLGEARLYRQVRLWADEVYRCNRLATVQGAKEPGRWLLMSLPLQTLWHAPGSSRRIVNGIASQGRLRREDSRYAAKPLWNVLFAALALLYATTGMQIAGLRSSG